MNPRGTGDRPAASTVLDGTASRSGRTPDTPTEGRFPRWTWAVYALLFGLSVPWYWPAETPLRLWLGLPRWVVVSLAATLAIAIFTAVVAHRYWHDAEPPDA